MAKPFRSLWEQMSPEAQAAAEPKMQAMLAAMPLQALQQARHLAHAHLTTVGQGTPARLATFERRTDLYISTLRSVIEAMGGALEITAKFPDGVVRITRFHDLAASEPCEPGALPAEETPG
jgi:hypothetical protein